MDTPVFADLNLRGCQFVTSRLGLMLPWGKKGKLKGSGSVCSGRGRLQVETEAEDRYISESEVDRKTHSPSNSFISPLRQRQGDRETGRRTDIRDT